MLAGRFNTQTFSQTVNALTLISLYFGDSSPKGRQNSVMNYLMIHDVHCVISFWSNRLSGKCPYISAQTNINSKTLRLPKTSSCGLDVLIARSYQKYDCLRKVKKVVFCLCMNWKLCDSDQTTGKQRVSKILRNK